MWPLSYGNSLQMSIGASTFWVMTITCIFSLYAWRCHEWKCMLAVELGWLFRVEVACHFLVYSGLFGMEQIVTYLLRVCPREEPSYLSMEKSLWHVKKSWKRSSETPFLIPWRSLHTCLFSSGQLKSSGLRAWMISWLDMVSAYS